MRKTVLATAVAAALTLSAADASAQSKAAATKAEVQAIETQMRALMERLNKLEATNTQLQSDNAELKALADRREAEMDYLKAQTRELREEGAVASNEVAKIKGTDWAGKIKFKGDLRMRSENIEQERVVRVDDTTAAIDDAADRNRTRIRARFGFDATVTDNVKATLQLASGDSSDNRSTNQTIGNSATKKSIWLDQAYIDWKLPYLAGTNLLLGKMKYPFWRPGQSMFYDGDVNPEGVALIFDRGMLFGSLYGHQLWENGPSDPEAITEDSFMVGLQAGLKFALAGGETRVALHYYDVMGAEGFNPFATGSANGNTTVSRTLPTTTSSTQVLLYDYDVLMGGAEMGLTVANLPLSLWADYAQNIASGVEDDETAYAVGAVLGKASNPKTWEIGLSFQEIGKDALFAQYIDSDFGDGVADADGWVLKAGYAPVKNFTINGTYLLNTRNLCGPVTSATDPRPTNRQCLPGGEEYELDYDRLQIDFNYKF
ncbi:MAG TPA: putative porin [Steroidobacteraceae bacterium]|nr:putative porin [Steroidobacteraceae bacterium]